MKAATVLWDQTAVDQWHATQSAAAILGIHLLGIELTKHPYDYGQAMSQLVSNDRDPLFVVMSGFFFRDRHGLASFALERRLASFFGTREFVDAGGLMSYGPSILGLFRQAAEYADKIGHGAKPADLPVQQPTKFELVVNLKTAKTIGIEIPPTLLARADEVIE